MGCTKNIFPINPVVAANKAIKNRSGQKRPPLDALTRAFYSGVKGIRVKKEFTKEDALRSSKKIRLVITIFSGFIIFVGVLIIGKGLNNIYYAKQSQSWNAVSAVVIESSIKTHHEGAGLKDQTRNRFYYSPKVIYAYKVANKSFTNDRIKFF